MPEIRIDRALSLGLVRPLRRFFGVARVPRIPILMYHGIRPATDSMHPYFETRTAPKVFAAQMRYLLDRGYRAVDLEEAAALLASGRDTANVVAITFDDGFLDFYSSAFPVLLECGFSATVFVMPGFIQSSSDVPREHTYMSWEEIREVQEYGIRIGSHTMSHADLCTMPWKVIERELADSRDAISNSLGVAVPSFAYPYAFPEHDHDYIRGIRRCLADLGYKQAVTTIVGSAVPQSDPFLLPRIPVNTHDDIQLFEAKLSGAYDWMHAAQYARKLFRSNSGAARLRSAANAVAL